MDPSSIDNTAQLLARAGNQEADRLRSALTDAVRWVESQTPAPVAAQAGVDFLRGVALAGTPALDGGDPQAIENALYAERPDSPLSEWTLRNGWLALVDHLARTGDKPPYGGSGGAESWAFTARSRPWPFVGVDALLARAIERFGGGVQVVTVRGPGKSSFLAATRRAILAQAGADAIVPPVLPAARDDVTGVLRPYLKRAKLAQGLADALDKLALGEDLFGVLGRAGDHQPVALLLDDAHLQGRSALLGLPLLVEPAEDRATLLIAALPDDPKQDGPFADVIADARPRGCLTELTLPAWSVESAAALIAGWAVERDPAKLFEATRSERGPAALASAQAWLRSGDEAFDLRDYLPAHEGAQRILASAAVEGELFHGFALGAMIGQDEDYVEDLLHDDEFELDGALVGTCDKAVPPARSLWSDLPDGLHPVFRFADARVPAALRRVIPAKEFPAIAGRLRDALLNAYGPTSAWQVADRLWRLDVIAGGQRHVQQLLSGTRDPARVEAGFKRLLPALTASEPFHLALARLFGAAMEMGALGASTGKVVLADQGFQAAAAAAQRLGRPGAAGEALARLAEVRVALALPQPARSALDLATKLLRQAGHVQSLARIALIGAEATTLEGRVGDAIDELEAVLPELRESGDKGHVALALVRLGRLQIERGDQAGGTRRLDEAIQMADEARDPRPAGAARLARARVHAEQGALEAAFELLQAAANAFQAAQMPVAIVEIEAAGLQRRHGNPGEAAKRLKAVAEAFKKAGAAIQWADAAFELARCALDEQRFTEAGTLLVELIEIRKRGRDRFGLIRAFEALADALGGQGDTAGRIRALAQGRRLAERMALAGHLGRLDASLLLTSQALDGEAGVDEESLRAAAADEIDQLEAIWAAPPQAPAASGSVH